MLNNTNNFIIKPVRRQSVQGRRLTVTDPFGRKSSTDSVPKATMTFSIMRRPDGRLNTGLDYYVDNPYKASSSKEARLPVNWVDSEIWKNEKILRQTELEIKYNLSKNYLTNIPTYDLRRKRKQGVQPTFLEEFRMRLENVENKISMDNLKGEIMYEAAKVSSLIANSEAEITPFSRFYIAEVNEEEVKKAKKQRVVGKALAKLEDLIDNHSDAMKKVAVITKVISSHEYGVMPLVAIYSKLSDYINDIARGNMNIDEFEKYYEMYKNKTSKKRFETLFFLRELVGYHVLSEMKGAVYWVSKNGTSLYELGKTEEVVIQWLMDEGNKPYVTDLKHELKLKKNEY